jgi:Flp pilus assembly protein CpaB
MAAAAIVLALVAGIGVYVYASNADKRAQENASFVDAYVATSDIAKGTTGEEAVQAGLIQQAKVAKGSLPPSAVTNLNDLAGKVAASRIDMKQFVTAQTFVSASDGVGGAFAQSIKSQDLVAVTVTVDADHGVANAIAPGDHVNIATTTTDANGNPQTDYLMESVKVLAVGTSTAQGVSPGSVPAGGSTTDQAAAPSGNQGVLTFEVSKADALRVIAANSGNSKIYLVLLPPGLSSTSTGSPKTAASSK